MTAQPIHGHYETQGRSECILAFDDNFTSQILIVEGLLEERNFLRRTAASVARRLADRGIGCAIPDLPGCGESLADISGVTLADWRAAIADAAAAVKQRTGVRPHIASFRGGALIDHTASAASWWRLAPATGADLLRPFHYAQRLGHAADMADVTGYALNAAMLAELEEATPTAPNGQIRETPVQSAGAALWRRAEPAEDLDLVERIAADLQQWIEACAAA